MNDLDLAKPPKSRWLWIILLLAVFVGVVAWYATQLTNTNPGGTAASSSPSGDPSADDTSVPLVLPTTSG